MHGMFGIDHALSELCPNIPCFTRMEGHIVNSTCCYGYLLWIALSNLHAMRIILRKMQKWTWLHFCGDLAPSYFYQFVSAGDTWSTIERLRVSMRRLWVPSNLVRLIKRSEVAPHAGIEMQHSTSDSLAFRQRESKASIFQPSPKMKSLSC